MSRYTFLDTLNEIEKRAQAEPVQAPAPGGAGGDLRGLAGELRKLAEAPEPLTYEELYAVRSGAFALPDVPGAPSGEGPGAPLRKLAHDLRVADRAIAEAKVAQANDILKATGGLSLLRERLGE